MQTATCLADRYLAPSKDPPPDFADFGSSSKEANARRKLRVMVVEDELFVAIHLEALLEDLGYEVTGLVSNGESAVREYSRQHPDLILMDINLGKGMDGVTAAQKICKSGDPTVVFVSAYSDNSIQARIAAAFPAGRLISKPVTPVSLKEAIGEVGKIVY